MSDNQVTLADFIKDAQEKQREYGEELYKAKLLSWTAVALSVAACILNVSTAIMRMVGA